MSFVKNKTDFSSADYSVIRHGEEKKTSRAILADDFESSSKDPPQMMSRRKDLDSFTSDPRVLHTMNKQSVKIANSKYR